MLTGTSHHQTTFVSREGSVAEQRPTLEVCYTPLDFCADDPCQNGGTCDSTPSGFTCSCPAGYTGTTCATKIDACAAQPCQNGGACSDAGSGYTCACVPGYTGASCETNIDDCASAPCQNGGVCTDGVDSFTCTCPAGYAGATCETLIDHCDGAPCQNGGACTNSPGGYTCACADGFTGTNCESNIDDCAGDPCHNGGTCIDGVASFSCVCPPAWGGATCDVNLDTCAEDPCLHGGACTNGFGTYTCACAAGYAGANCEIDIDDCASSPCANGGVCVDGVNSFACTCPVGFTGASCETNVDDCASDPSQNGGRCTDGVASYTCACPVGFTGANCEVAQVEVRGTLRTFPAGLPGTFGFASPVLGYELYPISSFGAGDAALWTDVQVAGSPYKVMLDETAQDTFVFDVPAFAPTGTTDAFSLALHTTITYVPGTRLVVTATEPLAVYLDGHLIDANPFGESAVAPGTIDVDTLVALGVVHLTPNQPFALDLFYTHVAGPGTPLHLELSHPICSVKTHSGYETVPLDAFAVLGNVALGPVSYSTEEIEPLQATQETAIRLTVDIAAANTSGAAWWPQPIATGRAFRVEYDVHTSPPATSEGYAFVMASTMYLGGVGPDLGYTGAPSVAVEFDLHQDFEYGDPNAVNSVAIHSAGAAPNTASELFGGSQLGQSSDLNGPPIDTGGWIHMTVEYEPGGTSALGWLRVYTDNGISFRDGPSVDRSVPIVQAQIPDSLVAAALGDRFFIGFTSSTQASPPVAGETDILHVRVAQPDCASCKLVSPQTSSVVAAPTSVLAGKQGSFVVQSADPVGRPFHGGGAAACFAASIVDGSDVQAATVSDNGDGTYTVSYRPDQPGTWLGFARLGGSDITGSPVVFTAQ